MVVGSSPLLRIRRHNGIDNVTDVTSITFLSSSPRYITSFLNGSVTLATTCSSNKLQQQVDVESCNTYNFIVISNTFYFHNLIYPFKFPLFQFFFDSIILCFIFCFRLFFCIVFLYMLHMLHMLQEYYSICMRI